MLKDSSSLGHLVFTHQEKQVHHYQLWISELTGKQSEMRDGGGLSTPHTALSFWGTMLMGQRALTLHFHPAEKHFMKHKYSYQD